MKKRKAKSWRHWLSRWRKATNERIKLVSSLSKKTPYGTTPSGNPYKNKTAFMKALRRLDEKVAWFRLKTMNAYQRQTGKKW